MKLLEGKVAIVTGATKAKGLGKAIAVKLAEQGAMEYTTVIAAAAWEPARFSLLHHIQAQPSVNTIAITANTHL